jgi:type 1 glutamine amidotransferase
MYNLSDTLEEPAKDNLQKFVESQKGLIILHHALGSYNTWEWWYKEVVGGRYVMKSERDQPASTFAMHQQIVAKPTGSHPITSSLGGFPMHLYDEAYKGLWISPDVEVLLETGVFTSDRPVVWISPYQHSRVVVIVPGHGWGAHFNLGFRYLLKDAILWAGKKI